MEKRIGCTSSLHSVHNNNIILLQVLFHWTIRKKPIQRYFFGSSDSTQADAAFCHRKWIKWLCSTCLPIHFSSGSHKWFVEGHIADHIFPKWDDTTFTWSKNGSSHLLVQRSSRPLLFDLNQQKYLGLVLNLNGRVDMVEKRSETKKWGLYITSHHLNHPFLVIFIVGSFRYLLLHLHFFS